MLKDIVFGSGIEQWDLLLAARQELDLRRANVISVLQCCALKLTSRTPSVTIICLCSHFPISKEWDGQVACSSL